MAGTVAAKLIDILVQAGVKRIHGVVGDSLNGIVDEIRRSGKIQWIHYRHEEAAAFAAGAEAQVTGQLAVCAGSCGPGNLHLINGLYDCHRSMAPVLAIAAHIPSSEIGTGYFQETHPESVFKECSHYCELISSSRQMPRILQMAMQHAIGLGGVAVVTISGDVALQKVEDDALQHRLMIARPAIRPSNEELQTLADLINGTDKVTLLCGSGCKGAHAALMQLGSTILSPMVHALRGKEHVEYNNPYDVGMTGLIGFASGYHAMEDADLLVLLGTDFPYKDFYPTDKKIVQIDIRAERLGRRCKLDLGLMGDVKETLLDLLPLIKQKSNRAHLDKCVDRYKASRKSLDSHAKGTEKEVPIHPEYVARIVGELAQENAIFTADVGAPTVWAARYLRMESGRRLIGSFNHGSMAAAMPMAIGAQFVDLKRQVIALCGDGGFAMLMGDFLTLLQYQLPVKVIIFNNSSLGFVALEQKVAGYPPYGTDLVNPNFASMAEAIGIKGIRVEKPEEVKPALEAALAQNGPVLVDVVVSPVELAMPPKITFEQAKGFSLYMLRQTLAGDGQEVLDTIKANFL